ncbi:MAG: DUF3299 domain-containing protein [Halomonadaceae bacterium]|nr:MAG: DUF3299 domain-containing protein [Halomonadaceae bacterium]
MLKTLLLLAGLALAIPAVGMEYPPAHWGQLVPLGWPDRDPLNGVDVSRLEDEDPKAIKLYGALRAYYDQAPTVSALDSRHLSLPGYLVPLPERDQQATGGHYLLVPYDGACIHQPAPARNQTILIRVADSLDLRAQDIEGPVQVSGELTVEHQKTELAATGYSLHLHDITHYRLRFN